MGALAVAVQGKLYVDQESKTSCHARSMSHVGTKKKKGDEETRSRNLRLIFNYNRSIHGTGYLLRVVPRNAMDQRYLVLTVIKETRLAPTYNP